MKSRPFFALLLCFPLAVQGQEAVPMPQNGDEALAAGLWEVATASYQQQLSMPGLSAEEKTRISLRLAEAWIRSGREEEALKLLDQSWVAKDPEAGFWKAQALAGLERYAEALAILAPLLTDPTIPHRKEAVFSMASWQLALNQADAALATLELIARDGSPAATEAMLRKVEILMDLQRLADARTAMPPVDQLSAKTEPLAGFFEAQLLLAERKYPEAASAFATILEKPEGQSLIHFHSAALGLADAMAARGQKDEATDSLLTFLQAHPDSPMIEGIFQRLVEWMDEKPDATEPVLERLKQWIQPTELPVFGLISPNDAGAVNAWATAPETNVNLLSQFSIFTRALGLHRVGTRATADEADWLMTRLRVEHPTHFLAHRALLETGKWLLAKGKSDEAFAILDSLRLSVKPSPIKGAAAFLEARAAYASSDPQKAAQLFDEAAASLEGPAARAARMNAAIARAAKPGISDYQGTPKDGDLSTDIALEQALSETRPAEATVALENFIRDHPDHPRMAVARLSLAENALAMTPPDLMEAKNQVERLIQLPQAEGLISPQRLALVRLRIADLTGNSEVTTEAKAMIAAFPNDPVAAEAALVMGRNLFQAGSYNDARLVLEKLAASDTDSARAQAAWLLAARAAALGATSKSREEALVLFDKAIEGNGPITPIAVLEKARLMIDVIELKRLPEAISFLRKWLGTLPESDPLRLPAGLLLGEAIYAQGTSNPEALAEALAVYNQLLIHAENQPTLLHRLQYLRGMTLERLPRKDNPALKRDSEALAAYYSVLENGATTPPAEWNYFERCGFRAFEMLKNAGRYEAAIAVAEKLASFNGPQAAEATAAAKALRLKHMIWED